MIAGLARLAWGVVTYAELRNAGLSRDQVRHRVKTGALVQVYRCVYLAGFRSKSPEALYMAAVKACGPGALLCGKAAAWLLGLIKGKAPPPEVVVLKTRRVKGLKTRTGKRGGTKWRGIPVTTPAETLVDVASLLQSDELARSCAAAGTRHKTTPRQVKAVLNRRPNAKGQAELWRIMSGETKIALSVLEKEAHGALDQLRLDYDANAVAGTKRVDMRIPSLNLTIELDSYTWHNSFESWRQSLVREREAYARGDSFRRYDWEQVTDGTMLAELLPLAQGAS